jgi:hypothetical protein
MSTVSPVQSIPHESATPVTCALTAVPAAVVESVIDCAHAEEAAENVTARNTSNPKTERPITFPLSVPGEPTAGRGDAATRG